jgi:AcrR family transcriptional regulator
VPAADAKRRQRVPSLSPEERRAALIAATIPLLREHGTSVSTRQIADAAGVAEGTIFGVFKDKATLIRAAIVVAFDPAPLIRSLREVDPTPDLRARLVVATRLLREHVAGHGALFYVIRSAAFAADREGLVDLMASRYLILYELANLIEPDAALLRRNPSTAARLLMSLVAAPRGAFGILDETLDDDDVVSLVLDGLLIRDRSPALTVPAADESPPLDTPSSSRHLEPPGVPPC